MRREPKAVALHGGFLYFADDGTFVGEGDDTRYVEDGALFRVPRDGSGVQELATGLGVVTGIVVGDAGVLVADRRGDVNGLWLHPHDGGPSRAVWSGGPVERMDADLFTIDDRLDAVWQDPWQPRELLRDAGYVEAVAAGANAIAIGGLVDGNTSDGIVVILRAGEVVRRLSLPRRWVRGLAFEGDDLLVAVDTFLLRVGQPGAATSVERAVPGELRAVRVHDGVVFWLVQIDGPRFSVRAGKPGAPAVELAAGDGAGWQFVVDDDAVHFVTSAPVLDPWTKVPTPFRIGRVPWRACVSTPATD